MSSVVSHVRSNTNITWYEWFSPDNEDMTDDPYGIVSVTGPFESRYDQSICGIEKQPEIGQILISVVARTPDAVKYEAGKVHKLLRGWSPGPGVSGLKGDVARGYEPVESKFKPTLITRNMLYSFTTNL